MAKPKPYIDENKLKALMRLKPTLEDTASFFECSERTIERHIKEQFKITFKDFRERHMASTRLELVRTAIKKATNGDNTMLIFCLKNLCEWNDGRQSPSTLVQVKTETNVNTNEHSALVEEFKQVLVGYRDERKE